MKNHAFRRSVRGVGMIEILVALLILVFGVLGIAALQMTALRNSQSSMQHTQAVQHLYGSIDRLRANVERARIGQYDLGTFARNGSGDFIVGSPSVWTCDLPDGEANNLPKNERREWLDRVKNDLGPQACGIIDCNDLACGVAIKWDDSRATGGATDKYVSTSTRL